MSDSNYWSRVVQQRTSRRRALAATGATALGAALLAACGGGSSGTGSGNVASRIGEAVDTSKDAKKGGIYQGYVNGDEATLDPLASARGAGFGGPSVPGYSRILREEEAPSDPKVAKLAGDLAESWELTNDGLTLTVKLRPDAKWDQRAPTNSRQVDADDVVFSLNKFFAQSPYASQLSYNVDPASPVQSVAKIDARTVQYKMAFPWSPLLLTLAHGNHLILPKEAEDKFDPRNTIRGSNAWTLAEYRPAAFFNWRRNPNWYRKDVPFLEGYDQPIIPEVASQLSQFSGKNVWDITPQPDAVPGLLAAESQLQLFLGELGIGKAERSIAFGSRPGSPFYDIRVRRAVSMSLDRDLFAEVDSANDRLRPAGFSRDVFIDSHLPASYKGAGYWLDPKGEALGESGKDFPHNLTEAKQLMSAAGLAGGLDVDAPFDNRGVHINEKSASILSEMMAQIGLRLKLHQVDYNTVFLPKIWVPGPIKGDYDGLSFGSAAPLRQPHVVSMLYIAQHSKGSFTASRRWDDGLDKTDAIIEKAAREFDQEKQKNLIFEAQRELAKYMSGVTYSYSVTPFVVTWPWVKNFGVFRTSQGINSLPSPYLHVWIDESKKT